MNYLTFAKELKNYPAFTLKETEKLTGKVYNHRLVDWQKKGYIKRIANGVYVFADEPLDEMHLFYLANKIYESSYISLETAFAYYGFIPEAVYRITSVSSKKTSVFQHDNIVFSYRTIRPSYNFGYSLVRWKNVTIKIAEPEKAMIDFFYLNPAIRTPEHIEDMRFNIMSVKGRLDWEKIKNYLTLYDNKNLTMRIILMKDWIVNA
ncbi:MAG: hypothetical protein Q8N83_14630 [Ignavibacteria bacterium]|nr:hypothetical protein [Ignavibacteria bacterium]